MNQERSPRAAPAMSPSDLPVTVALDRATGTRRAEAEELLSLFARVTNEPPVVWAGRIIGFGEYEYRHDSGRSGRAPELAFASGRTNHTIYLVADFADRWADLLAQIGPHRASKVCLYLTRLTNVNRDALRALLELSLAATRSGDG